LIGNDLLTEDLILYALKYLEKYYKDNKNEFHEIYYKLMNDFTSEIKYNKDFKEDLQNKLKKIIYIYTKNNII